MSTEQTLSDALEAAGIRHEHHDGLRRKLFRGERFLGLFAWDEAWAYLAAEPAEDLTPEGIQLVIPGAERIQPASVKQGELF